MRGLPEKTLPAIIADYRFWVCRNLGCLLAGDRTCWREFRQRREFFLQEGPMGRRLLAWEQGFLHDALLTKTLSRATLCRIAGISPATLRSHERLGLLRAPSGEKVPFPSSHLKRLQWTLFFLKELRIPASGLSAMLSCEPVNRLMESLSRSAPANLPVHRSPPGRGSGRAVAAVSLSPAGRKSLREMFHDLGNRFHVMGGRANLLRRKMAGNPVTDRNLAIILAQVESAEGILKAMRKSLIPD